MARRATRRGIPAGTWFGAQSFHTFMMAPVTRRMLDSLYDNAAGDAAIEAARTEDRGEELAGSRCSSVCGFCGACS